jgi:hypothetical protein
MYWFRRLPVQPVADISAHHVKEYLASDTRLSVGSRTFSLDPVLGLTLTDLGVFLQTGSNLSASVMPCQEITKLVDKGNAYVTRAVFFDVQVSASV